MLLTFQSYYALNIWNHQQKSKQMNILQSMSVSNQDQSLRQTAYY